MTANATTLPIHLGLILDGNRRWAKDAGLPRFEGHRRAYENLKTIGRAAIARGIKFVSVYAFSTENWQRSQDEVSYLMDLLYLVAAKDINELHKENIRVRFLGRKDRLSEKNQQAIVAAEKLTAANTKGTLALCVDYGGHQEIADATKAIVESGVEAGDISPELIASHLYAPDIPMIDLIIRTSGEQRLSNFMLWRAAYSELIFIEKHWPDFNEADLDSCLDEYAMRQRRFGA